MYTSTPNYADVAPAIVIAATNTVIVGAPGASFAIRIVDWHVGINKATTGIVDLTLTAGVAGAVIRRAVGLSVAGLPMFSNVIPEPGIQLPPNTALVLQESATIATGNCVAVITYFLDDIS